MVLTPTAFTLVENGETDFRNTQRFSISILDPRHVGRTGDVESRIRQQAASSQRIVLYM